MPQYEVEPNGEAIVRTRGRDARDAAGRVLALSEDATVEVGAPDLQGWCAVHLDGAEVARLRPSQRMRFRRD
ncbi:MAG: hypothetical protein AAGF99_12425 [Bacteroidota bacterium]